MAGPRVADISARCGHVLKPRVVQWDARDSVLQFTLLLKKLSISRQELQL